ncbi:uncharacterized protein BO88DRAFT_336553, partial [Aspergillus vadensis CBS 113365]
QGILLKLDFNFKKLLPVYLDKIKIFFYIIYLGLQEWVIIYIKLNIKPDLILSEVLTGAFN